MRHTEQIAVLLRSQGIKPPWLDLLELPAIRLKILLPLNVQPLKLINSGRVAPDNQPVPFDDDRHRF
jgi:hypothetical protein